MLWIIFAIWFMFVVGCAIMERKTNKIIYTILFLLSFVVVFYVPMFLK